MFENSGKMVEHDMLGEVRKDRYREAVPDSESYIPYNRALEGVRKSQWDPENPRRFFPRDLLKGLRSDHELQECLPAALYRYYTAIGSNLDRYHGIDAFVECIPDPVNESVIVRVTMDVTKNPDKGQYKADITVLVPRDGIDPKDDEYSEFIRSYTEQVKAEILTKVNEMGNVGTAH